MTQSLESKEAVLPAVLAVVQPLLPQAPGQADELDCRVYTLVILGQLLKWIIVPVAAITCIVGSVSVSPYMLLGLPVAVLIWLIGSALSRTTLWPDGSLHIPNITNNFMQNQPVGLVNGLRTNNCCVNAALQVAFSSPSVMQAIDALEEAEHSLKKILQGYRAAQAGSKSVAVADTQLVRAWVSDYSAQPRGGPAIPPHGTQADAGEILDFAIDALLLLDQLMERPSPAFRQTIVQKWTAADGEAMERRTHQPRLLLSLGNYLSKKGEIDGELTQEQIFIHYVMRPYFFDVDGRGGRATRKFAQPSEELFVQLNRFTHDAQYNRIKINDAIPTPMRVTLPTNYFAAGDGRPLTYEADSFFIHRGSLLGGHYVACRRVALPNGRSIWWEIDDNRVRPLTQREAEAELQNAYNIHYSRV
ncbi:MAG: hypothetical protein HYX48_03180 [Chlamydiales bacterium]|nr:hypothetical protein [Chlamydiales bacterium]